MEQFEPTERTRPRRLAARGSYDRKTIYRILDEGLVCHVAYVSDGKPALTPTLYVRDGDRLCLHGAQANRTLRSIVGAEAAVNVTLLDGLVLARSAFHHSINYRSVTLYGRGEEVSDPAEKARIFELLVEHVAPGRWEGSRPPSEQESATTLVVALPLEECAAKLRSGPPIDDAEDLDLPYWAGVLPAPRLWGAPRPALDLRAEIEAPEYLLGYRRDSDASG